MAVTETSAQAEAQVATRELRHVNTPIAQTWNYLRVNDLALTVPEPEATGKVYEAVPRIFAGIDAGIGEDAVRWVSAAAGDSRYVEVPRGTVREEPIVVAPGAGEAANVAVMVRAGATASVVVVADGHAAQAAEGAAANVSAGEADVSDATAGEAAGVSATSAALVRVYVERGATLSVTELVARADGQHLEGVGIHAEDSATVEVRQYALGGTATGVGFACDLAGAHAKLDLTTRYHVGAGELVDVNHLTRMRGVAGRAEMHANGVLADKGAKTVRQTIDLVHGAKDAQGNESDTTLVTGDDIVNKTLPTILCDEEDVAGNHGATIGSVSEEQLAYLEARGLSREEAEALFVRAIFDDAILSAPEATSRAAAVARAEAVLGAEVAHELADDLALSDPDAPATTDPEDEV